MSGKGPRSRRTYTGSARVTIRDIAARLDVSHTTVSRSLANSPKISDRTRNKVKAEARRVGYVANAAARAIRAPFSALAGIVIPDIKNDFYASIAKGIGEQLAKRGLQLILCVTGDNPNRELSAVRALAEARAVGLVITLSPAPDSETIKLLSGFNAVQLVRTSPSLRSPSVLIDDVRATAAATEHLISLGHRRLGYVGGPELLSSGRDRLQGFREALSNHGIACSAISLGSPFRSFSLTAVQDLMQSAHPPSGIVFGSSELTLGGLKALGNLGKRYPDDLSVVGFGDPVWFDFRDAGISTLRLPESAMAEAAAEHLMESIERRPKRSKPARSLFMPELIARDSSGPPPV